MLHLGSQRLTQFYIKKINLIIHKINLDEGRPSYDFMIRQFHVIR